MRVEVRSESNSPEPRILRGPVILTVKKYCRVILTVLFSFFGALRTVVLPDGKFT